MTNLTEKIQTLFGNGQKQPENSPIGGKSKEQIKAKQYDSIHKESSYEVSRKETKRSEMYLKAEKKLQDTSYAEDNYGLKEIVVKIRNSYPFVSIILGFAVALMAGNLFAEGFPVWAYWLVLVLVGCLSLAIISVLEIFKFKSLIAVFAKGRKFAIPAFLIFLTISIAISSGGGYLISLKINDKTADITAKSTNLQDSVKNQYQEQIELLKSQIQKDNEVLKKYKAGDYRTHYASERLAQNTPQLAELMQLQKSDISELETKKDAEISESNDLNQYKAYIIVLVVLVFEILYALSFLYEYSVEKNIKTENANHGIVKPIESEVLPVNSAQPLTFEQQMILQLMGGNNPNTVNLPYATTTKNEQHTANCSNTVGFNFGNTANRNNTVQRNNTVNSDYTHDNTFLGYTANGLPKFKVGEKRNCDCCGTEYMVTIWSKRFCSDGCRMDANNFDLENYKKGKYGKKGGAK